MAGEQIEVVRLEAVTKSFTLRTETSLKETVLNFFSRRKRSHKFQALNGLDLSIPSGTTVGLIGHNGSGKSTLLKIIGGILEPTTGTVERRGKLAALLELGAGFHPDLTGRENVYLNASILGLTKAEVDEKFQSIVEFSGIAEFIDTQVKFYSSGMYVRLAFAVAVNVDPDVLLVDEVLAVGDELFQQKCIQKIKEFQSQGRTIIIVSHAADQIQDLCDHVVLLEQGVPIFKGDPVEGIRQLRHSLRVRDGQVAETSTIDTVIQNLRVRVLSSAGASLESLPSGSGFTVEAEFTLDSSSEIASRLELQLCTSGVTFLCASDEQDSAQIPTQAGDQAVAFSIDAGHSLPTGEYDVTARILSVDGGVLAESTQPRSFTIVSKTESALDRPVIQGSFSVAHVE